MAMIPTALVGVAKHHRNKMIHYQVVPYIAAGLIVGGAVGAYIANSIAEDLLRKIFSAFFGIMSLQMFWSSYKQGKAEKMKEQ